MVSDRDYISRNGVVKVIPITVKNCSFRNRLFSHFINKFH